MQITDLAARRRKYQQLYYFAYIIYQYGKRLSMDSPDCVVVKDISFYPEKMWLGKASLSKIDTNVMMSTSVKRV